MSEYAVRYSDIDRDNFGVLHTAAHVYDVVKQYASKLLHDDNIVGVKLDGQTTNVVVRMCENGKIERVGSFSDTLTEHFASFDVSKGFDVADNLYNSVYYDESFRVVIVSFADFVNLNPFYNMVDFCVFGRVDDCKRWLGHIYSSARDDVKTRIVNIVDKEHEAQVEMTDKKGDVSFDDVFLDADLKKEISNSIRSFFNDDVYEKYNIPHKRGILLYGKPGNGKTTLIKAITNSTQNPVIYWQVNEYSHSGSLTNVFTQCKFLSPAILVIEDVDSIPESLRSMLLNFLDGGTYDSQGIFIIGTTNFPDKIDPALMNRAGRFDRAYEIKQPDADARYKYLMSKNLDKIECKGMKSVRYIAEHMDGFSMSTLNELYTSIVLAKYYDGEVDVDKIIASLKQSSDKQTKDRWYADDNGQVGF